MSIRERASGPLPMMLTSLIGAVSLPSSIKNPVFI